MLFDFMNMFYNYDTRAVARYEDGDLVVDTCSVSDSEKHYETAILHPEYNDNNFIIVAEYDTLEDAKRGHSIWTEIMTYNPLPEQIVDVSTANVAKLEDMVNPDWRRYERKPRT